MAAKRKRMVSEQLAAPERGIAHSSLMEVMKQVPRNYFVTADHLEEAHDDKPVDIGLGRTLEQPYVIAYVLEQLDPKPDDRVLEIGTGAGYQAAVLSHLVKEVYSVESLPELAFRAQTDIARCDRTNVFVQVGDATTGWPEKAPFDAIIVHGPPDQMPSAHLDQLKEGGRLVFSTPEDNQVLTARKSGRQMNTPAAHPLRKGVLILYNRGFRTQWRPHRKAHGRASY